MGYYTKGVTSEVCTNSKILDKTLRHTHIHTQLRIILGCGPNANLKSTNTHGTQQREKETEQGEASGYYAWTEVLCCCILKCVDWAWLQTQRGPQNVSLIGPKWNEVQMALIDNIRLRDTFQFVFLSVCVQLTCTHTFSTSVLYSLTLLTPFIHPPFPLQLSPFLFCNHYFLFIITFPDHTDNPYLLYCLPHPYIPLSCSFMAD